mmetsp:Transcript_11577/g.24695  ORF Transcript_11577/g.24695 Transcript_11577/m.24695 type:complete len:130 (-) Transcript_11577:1234-1623(-)
MTRKCMLRVPSLLLGDVVDFTFDGSKQSAGSVEAKKERAAAMRRKLRDSNSGFCGTSAVRVLIDAVVGMDVNGLESDVHEEGGSIDANFIIDVVPESKEVAIFLFAIDNSSGPAMGAPEAPNSAPNKQT